MAKTKVVIVTTTCYKSRTELRFHLACQTIGNAIGSGYQVVVVDGSPNPQIAESFRRIGANVWDQEGSTMGASRREAFSIAKGFNPDIVVWIEPEKVDLIRHIDQLTLPIVIGSADVVLMQRTLISWHSYPEFQQESEVQANGTFFQQTGKRLDIMSGPIAFRRDALDIFANCNPDSFGGFDTYIQHIAVMKAMNDGFRVSETPIDFLYPLAQRLEDEASPEMATKRRHQLAECAANYLAAASHLRLFQRSEAAAV
ncbi:MAG: hypothetical protein Q8L36_02010 [bacterium]|nr:hypothetical protein [bacterium]